MSAKLITGVLNPDCFADKGDYCLAMFSVLLAAGTFVLLATLTSLPVSSSHAIVGSLIGVSVFVGGIGTVNWGVLVMIVGSWFLSPLLAGFMSFLLLTFIKRVILGKPGDVEDIMARLTYFLPYVLSITVAVFVLILMKGSALAQFRPQGWEYAMFLGILCPNAVLVSQGILRSATSKMENSLEAAEGIFRRLQVGTSSYVAFAHGANDVANAISPVFAIYLVVKYGDLPSEAVVGETGVPLWILVLGGAGIALGIGTLGHRVIHTLSEKITQLDNFKGFSVDFAAATTVVTASLMGMPVSSTHAATGAIVGTGLQEGKGVQFRLLAKIIAAWVVTVPLAAVLTVGIFAALDLFF